MGNMAKGSLADKDAPGEDSFSVALNERLKELALVLSTGCDRAQDIGSARPTGPI